MRGDPTLPQYWHERAEEARVIAETMCTPEARGVMLQVAEGYRRLARRAERRVREGKRSVFDGEEAEYEPPPTLPSSTVLKKRRARA